jgi:hypothetical protein
MAKVKEPETIYAPAMQQRENISLSTPKEMMKNVLLQMSDNATYDDMMYEIYLLQKVERGLREIEEGKTVTHEEAKRRLRKWLK